MLPAWTGRSPVDFYPRPPRGGRLCVLPVVPGCHPDFYPRPPRGGRLQVLQDGQNDIEFLPTPSARRATHHKPIFHCPIFISTHALREEGDLYRHRHERQRQPISTHALREEGDNLRGERGPAGIYFYPRPPRGGRPVGRQAGGQRRAISTHALREEGDLAAEVQIPAVVVISTHALREEGDGFPVSV